MHQALYFLSVVCSSSTIYKFKNMRSDEKDRDSKSQEEQPAHTKGHMSVIDGDRVAAGHFSNPTSGGVRINESCLRSETKVCLQGYSQFTTALFRHCSTNQSEKPCRVLSHINVCTEPWTISFKLSLSIYTNTGDVSRPLTKPFVPLIQLLDD